MDFLYLLMRKLRFRRPGEELSIAMETAVGTRVPKETGTAAAALSAVLAAGQPHSAHHGGGPPYRPLPPPPSSARQTGPGSRVRPADPPLMPDTGAYGFCPGCEPEPDLTSHCDMSNSHCGLCASGEFSMQPAPRYGNGLHEPRPLRATTNGGGDPNYCNFSCCAEPGAIRGEIVPSRDCRRCSCVSHASAFEPAAVLVVPSEPRAERGYSGGGLFSRLYGAPPTPSSGTPTSAAPPPPAAAAAQQQQQQQERYSSGQSLLDWGGSRLGYVTSPPPQQHKEENKKAYVDEPSDNAAKPSSLSVLEKDCIIIPASSAERFRPEPITLPLAEKQAARLEVLEVSDARRVVLMHLMSPMVSIRPVLESPLARPKAQQESIAKNILAAVNSAKSAAEGMLLSNIEDNGEFPFILYYGVNTSEMNPGEVFQTLQQQVYEHFDPATIRYRADHTINLYREVASIAKPVQKSVSHPEDKMATAYVVCIYNTFDGDDGEKFEKHWLYWSGARMLYRYLPPSAGLQRITLHKSVSHGDKMYLLLCECTTLLQDLSATALLIPALRARVCGYTSIYRTAASFKE